MQINLEYLGKPIDNQTRIILRAPDSFCVLPQAKHLIIYLNVSSGYGIRDERNESTKGKNIMLVKIPFAGFYESLHSHAIDNEIEMQIEYFERDCGMSIPESFAEMLWFEPDYQHVHSEYAKFYVGRFLSEFDLSGKFESMDSPREYNFTTDRVYADISRDSIAKAWRGTDKKILARLCGERFTSYNGFISYYRPDYKQWGLLYTWDHNQLETLLLAYIETERGETWGQWSEDDLVEDINCNGLLSDWLCESGKYVRVLNALDYMRDRCQRTIRTMAQWHDARRAENRPFSETPLGKVTQ